MKGLYIGSYGTAANVERLQEEKITHIINLANIKSLEIFHPDLFKITNDLSSF